MKMEFPPWFLWGTATSAYQVEGGNYASDWWEWERRPGTPCAEPSGDACDHYHLYPQDLRLLASLGFNTYRFSIEWSRVEPEQDDYSRASLEHYRRVLEASHQHGLTPIVTFHHFTNPRWFTRSGGWERPDAPDRFARYCEVAARHLGDLIPIACTINEPNMPALLGYADALFPPGRNDHAARLRVTDAFLRGHLLARDVIKNETASTRVGLALSMADWHVVDEGSEQLEAIRRLREDVFLDGTAGDDFIGVNTYTRHRVGPAGFLPPETGVEVTLLGYEFYPQSLEATIRRAATTTALPVIVTENGIGTDDDARRIAFVEGALGGVHRCLTDGIDVQGYCYWSTFDNFEWNYGYIPTFGLIAVDRRTQVRSPKPSAAWLGRVARRGVLEPYLGSATSS